MRREEPVPFPPLPKVKRRHIIMTAPRSGMGVDVPNKTMDCPTCRGTGKILAPQSMEKMPASLPPPTEKPTKAKATATTKASPPAKSSGKVVPSSAASHANNGNGTGSGFRIRVMLKEGKLNTDQILAKIHQEFPGSKAKASDVAWNKRKLEQQGGVP